jgi:PASTA domain-containing protein
LSLVDRLPSIIRSIAIVVAIGVVFLFGVVTTVYLSLRSPEVKVPNVVGKDRFEAEKILAAADLKFRVRATRPSNDTNPDVVLFQLPRADEVVKTGQTVAMDISRPAKEGESPEKVTPDEDNTNSNQNANANANTNSNENKPKRTKPKNDNANTNGNTNANGNRNTNANGNRNANANANRAVNANKTNVNTSGNSNVPRTNVNRVDTHNVNARPASNNVNDNRRSVAPRPTPSVSNPTRRIP